MTDKGKLHGIKFGYLVAFGQPLQDLWKREMYQTMCACGKEVVVHTEDLLSGDVTDCGCGISKKKEVPDDARQETEPGR